MVKRLYCQCGKSFLKGNRIIHHHCVEARQHTGSSPGVNIVGAWKPGAGDDTVYGYRCDLCDVLVGMRGSGLTNTDEVSRNPAGHNRRYHMRDWPWKEEEN